MARRRSDGRALLEKRAAMGDAWAAEQITALDRQKRPKGSKRRHIEDDHQKILVGWLRDHGLKWFHHSPNESTLPGERGRGYAMGVSSGFPDLVIYQHFTRGGTRFAGLVIELKSPSKTPPVDDPWKHATDNQRAWLTHLQSIGYRVAVCHGFEAARDLITECYHHGAS